MYRPDKKFSATDERLLSREEILTALALLLQRMHAVDAVCADGFPLYAPGKAGQWVVSPGGSWVGGFWGGCWWLSSRLTGATADRRKAAAICQRLAGKIGGDSINRSMIFWYGAALGDLWFGDGHARKLAGEAAAALAACYDPKMNCIPVGTDMGGGKQGGRLVSVDTLASLIQLLGRSEQSAHECLARRHTDTLLSVCCSTEGAFHAHAHFGQEGFRAADRAGAWSRGQAWAMLGLTRAAARWGEPYLTDARKACEYWRRSRPEPLPANRLSQPSGLCDPSSAVIASLAMLSLASLTSDAGRWRSDAHRQLSALVQSRFFTGFRENSGKPAKGIFWGCCYKTGQGEEELAETPWGSFLLMAALCVLVDAIEPGDC